MQHPIRERLVGLTDWHDALALIEVGDDLEAISHYNHEIMGYTPALRQLPEIGQHIHYGGNAYYVLGELHRRGFTVTPCDDRKERGQ